MKHLLLLLLISFSAFAQDVWVNGYYKSDGTYIDGYYKTNPNPTVNDNYSTIGNQNPYTGEWGDKPRETSSNLVNIRPDIPAGNVVTPIALPFEPSMRYYNKAEEADRIEAYLRKHLKSPLNATPQAEMSFQDKINTLNDTRFKSEEYNIKPIEPATPNSDSKTIGILFWLFCAFSTFLVLFFLKKTKRL